jgi:RNA polymerase primary sigma factor
MTGSAATSERMDGRSRLGLAAAPDCELGLPEWSGVRHVLAIRARRILAVRIKFIGHPDFEDSDARAEILGPMPAPVGCDKRPCKTQGRPFRALSDAGFRDAKFLTREQEVHLFRKMNFLKHQAAQLQKAINPSHARSADLDRFEELLRTAGEIRNRIIGSYLGLVVSIVKNCAGGCQDLSDLVSEGNVSLIQASEQFDITSGARFSTYVNRAIFNDLARRIPRDRSHRARFATSREGLLSVLTDHRGSESAPAIDAEPPPEFIRKMLDFLAAREQTIIVGRFGLAGAKLTLAQLGRELGITRERVRQLEAQALDRLRLFARAQRLEPPGASA